MAKTECPNTINYHGINFSNYISLKESFKIERKAMRKGFPIGITKAGRLNKYLTQEKQKNHVITPTIIDNEKIFIQNNRKLNGEVNFIITCDSNPQIVCGEVTVCHSFLSNGKKVLAAGSLFFEDGYLIAASNNSGHYKPTNDEMLDVLKVFYVISNGTFQLHESHCLREKNCYQIDDDILSCDSFQSIEQFEIQDKVFFNRISGEVSDVPFLSSENTNRLHRSLKPEYTAFFKQ